MKPVFKAPSETGVCNPVSSVLAPLITIKTKPYQQFRQPAYIYSTKPNLHAFLTDYSMSLN